MIKNLSNFLALDKLKDTKNFTMPNADAGGSKIDLMIKKYVKNKKIAYTLNLLVKECIFH